MKLNEITETGFYTGELDNKREIIYEVINNTDEEWLKETPEQKLLIDEWTYEYTDEDNRKHYEIYGGNLVAVVNAGPIDVIKITDTKYTMDVSDPTIASKCNGTAMMEAKPTRLEIAQQQLDQLKAENDKLKTYITSFDYLDALSNEQVAVLYTACIDELAIRGCKVKYKTEASLLTRYHNALTEIKEIVKQGVKIHDDIIVSKQILQKISECGVEEWT